MTLLEDPLGREVSLPPAFTDEQQHDRRLPTQTCARPCPGVAGAAGRPVDDSATGGCTTWSRCTSTSRTRPTSRSGPRGLIPLLGMPDSLMRDHRKIAFYDLTEDDPYKGEAMFTGMGIGEHYAGATWEDRALIVQGPAALEAKAALRRLLARQGAQRTRRFPRSCARSRSRPTTRTRRGRRDPARRKRGAIPPARAMQTHNEAGLRLQAGQRREVAAHERDASRIGHHRPGLALGRPPLRIAAPRQRAARVPGPHHRTGARQRAGIRVADDGARAHAVQPPARAVARGSTRGITAEGGLLQDWPVQRNRGRRRHCRPHPRGAHHLQHRGAVVPAIGAVPRRTRSRAGTRRPPTLEAARPPTYLVHPVDAAAAQAPHEGPLRRNARRMERALRQAGNDDDAARGTSRSGRVRSAATGGWTSTCASFRARCGRLAGSCSTAHHATLSDDQLRKVAYYLQIGSFNMNDRSMLFDGEAAVTVSGPAALTGMLDFIMVAGLSTWVERQEQIDALLPPPSGFKRLLARWGRSAL